MSVSYIVVARAVPHVYNMNGMVYDDDGIKVYVIVTRGVVPCQTRPGHAMPVERDCGARAASSLPLCEHIVAGTINRPWADRFGLFELPNARQLTPRCAKMKRYTRPRVGTLWCVHGREKDTIGS